ncbi:hypothetical protein ACES2L_06070 [Bdellovibrio bacteriovorus]
MSIEVVAIVAPIILAIIGFLIVWILNNISNTITGLATSVGNLSITMAETVKTVEFHGEAIGLIREENKDLKEEIKDVRDEMSFQKKTREVFREEL